LQTRATRLQRLRDSPRPSVLIIGAGINGIGTFRDLALQGVDVVIVDRGDYCSGASAASSHMVHGGIRYLENGEFRLVREAVQERNRLIENAPHLVDPLPTAFPIFKLFSGLLNAPLKFLGLLDRPAERGAVVLKLGMTLYDFYTREQKTVPKHVFRNREASLRLFPALNPEIKYTGTYYDGAMASPERIALELILDAVHANDRAIALNYVGLESANGEVVTLKDHLSGETLALKPEIVINAAGPWIDLVNESLGERTDFIGGTKGSHVILDHPELRRTIRDHEFLFENKDGRIVLIFPLRDKVMIGTSDIRIDDPNGIVISEAEIDYFFDMIGRVFPAIRVNRSNIVFTFSGVRPLQRSEDGSTGQISRDHKLEVVDPGELLDVPVLSLVGGKWTSFRAFAALVADEVLERLGRSRRLSTIDLPIGGGAGYPATAADRIEMLESWQQRSRQSRERIDKLFDRYGMRAEMILAAVDRREDASLEEYPDLSHGEIEYICQHEDVVHLDDFVFRRSLLAMLGRLTPAGLAEVGQACASALGWAPDKTAAEIERVRSILRLDHRMDFTRYIGSRRHGDQHVSSTM
jgi:glycerol-3-phosphate dehydrogenase